MIYPLKDWKKLKRGYKFGQKTSYSNFHLGLDIIAPSGTPILAWQTLDIIDSYYGLDGGNTALIRCPNNKRLFRIMHLQFRARIGRYQEGQEIAKVDNTGRLSTGPHLHIDISKNGKLNLQNLSNFEDPEAYFQSIVEPPVPSYAIKVTDPKQLKELKEEYLIRSGGNIYTTLKKINNPSELKRLTESQIVRIGQSIYRKLP